jgi:hypothetical protein
MKEDLIDLQHFNYKLAQRKTKSSLKKASVDNNFVFLRGRDVVVSASPHNRHVPKVPSSHVLKMTLFNGRFSEDSMAWSPGPILRIFIPTFHIIAIAVTSIFRQTFHYFFSNLLCFCFCHGLNKSSNIRIHSFFSSNNFVSSATFVSAVSFISSVIFSPDMVKTCL